MSWIISPGVAFLPRWSDSHTGGKFFEQEFEFYLSCGEALTSLVIFLLTSLAILLAAAPRVSAGRDHRRLLFPTAIR